MNGYRRNQDGTLTIVGVVREGTNYHGLTPTDAVETLRGWPDEGPARIYVTDGGVEVLIPIDNAEAAAMLGAAREGRNP